MNFRYPIFLDLSGKNCLVTGQGLEIPGKIRSLVQRGAKVTYVNPAADEGTALLAREGALIWHAREFEDADLDDCFLVITDREDNSHIFELAEQKRVLCNAVDDPAHCRFSFGSLVSRGDLNIAISTNGIAPALAVRLRERLEKEIGDEYGEFLTLLAELRPAVASAVPNFDRRRELWYRMIDSAALDLIRNGHPEAARSLLQSMIRQASASDTVVE